MPINQSFLGEFDHEMATTRKVLERVPDDKLGWKPHEKSMTFGKLASHLVDMVGWTVGTMAHDNLDLAPPGGAAWTPFEAANNAALLSQFDRNVKAARASLEAATDDAVWMATWSLQMGGKTVMSMPRVACVRTMIFNHIVHHRGQLSVYLRENNIPVPSIYGPSADEGSMGA